MDFDELLNMMNFTFEKRFLHFVKAIDFNRKFNCFKGFYVKLYQLLF